MSLYRIVTVCSVVNSIGDALGRQRVRTVGSSVVGGRRRVCAIAAANAGMTRNGRQLPVVMCMAGNLPETNVRNIPPNDKCRKLLPVSSAYNNSSSIPY